jgi:putative secretion ATPase (PEP-CTERM system associated)
MYERFYQLRNRPFALSPDPDFLYPSRVHREALDYLRFGIEGHAGFVVVTGEIGSGKTTLLQVLLRSLDGQTTVIRIVNTLLNGSELLEAMLLDLGVTSFPMSKPAMVRELARLLISERARGRRVVAIIDEAQNLSLAALEELRMLSNLETEKSKLIQIVLVGQPDLRASLDLPSLEQLRQRVTVRYHLGPLDAGETAAYINHRLARAAAAAPLELSRAVTDLVHARSGGMPRMINVICDAALLVGYAENARVIDVPLMQLAISELEASTVLRRNGASAPPAMAEQKAGRFEPAAPSLRETTLGATPQHSVSAAPVAAAATAARPSAPLDNRLRQPSATPDFPARPRPAQTPPQRQQWTLQRSQMAHLAAPATRAAAHVQPAAEKPTALAADPDSRRTGGWGRVKTLLFGFDPEAERR